MNDVTNALQKQVGGKHYKDMKIQPMEYNQANGIPYTEGNIIKYVSTWRFREGLMDLEKALHYLEYLIACVKAEQKPKPTIINMAPALDEDGKPFPLPGTPEDGGHHARQTEG
jgi:hypothetical protein